MAYYKIEENKKGLVAKIQVHTKDIKTGKPKIVTKRIYNEKNLTLAKFDKYIERYSMDFEEDVINAYADQTYRLKNKILTFDQLGKEFLTNIKTNLSMSYYIRAKDVVERFNSYLRAMENYIFNLFHIKNRNFFEKYTQKCVFFLLFCLFFVFYTQAFSNLWCTNGELF